MWRATSSSQRLARVRTTQCMHSAGCARTHSQEPEPARSDVAAAGPRPMADAILELQRRHGWIITYEAPPYEFAGDILDRTSLLSGDRRDGRRVVGPRFRPLAFRYDSPDARPGEVLSAMLASYNQSGNGDEFHLMQAGDVSHVVPKSSRGPDGMLRSRQSRLGTPVTVESVAPDEEGRTAFEMLQLVLEQVPDVAGMPKVGLGTAPINLLMQSRLHDGAMNEPARDVLVRILAATGARLSWRLLCTPGGGTYRVCAFNVHHVPPAPSQ